MKDVCQISPAPDESFPGGAGPGWRHWPYLDGGHLCVSSPAEALKLQRVVAEAHSPASRRGAFLQLKFQVMKVREIMVPRGSGEEKEHCYLLGYLEGEARGHLRQARSWWSSSPDVGVPIPVVAEATVPKGANGRQSTPGCISCQQLTGCRWGHVCSAGSDRLRSAPRRMAPGTRRRHTGSLGAGNACLHSRRANELLVTNQRRIPAQGG